MTELIEFLQGLGAVQFIGIVVLIVAVIYFGKDLIALILVGAVGAIVVLIVWIMCGLVELFDWTLRKIRR